MAYINEYFKIEKEGTFIGTATDQNFARYSEKGKRVLICQAVDGEYVICNDRYYRDDWMLPLKKESYAQYENAKVSSITKQEYDILAKGLDSTPEIRNDEKEEPEANVSAGVSYSEATAEFVRNRKIQELSDICNKIIEDGFSLVLSDGASHHFSMSMRDQINLITLQQALMFGHDMIYHADNELEQFYSAEDALMILDGSRKWKNYHIALFNSFKNWIKQLNDISVINSITFDSEIPEEYCTSVLISLSENF